jgi:hypothetical protein
MLFLCIGAPELSIRLPVCNAICRALSYDRQGDRLGDTSMLRRMVTSPKIKLLDLQPQQHHNEDLKTCKYKLLHASRAVASLPSGLAPSVDRSSQSELLEVAPVHKTNVAMHPMRQKQTRRIAKSSSEAQDKKGMPKYARD